MSELAKRALKATGAFSADGYTILLVLALVVATAIRLTLPDAPLWLDETWTGVVASRSSFAEAVWQMRADVSAPLYYLVAWLWSALFGVQDHALRAPSLIFSLIAPLLTLAPQSGLPRPLRALWCALVACWIPASAFAMEARCYSLLLLLGVGLTVAFLRFARTADLKGALLWSVLGAAVVLTHYHAGFLVACQGGALLIIHRARLLRLWPAAAPFAICVAWIAWHLPRIAAFARPDAVWYSALIPFDLVSIVAHLAGMPHILLGVLLWSLAVWFMRLRTGGAGAPLTREDRLVLAAAAASAAGVCIIVAIAFVRPSLTFRYLTPFAPAILLGLAWAGWRAQACWRLAPFALGGLYVAGAAVAAVQSPPGAVNLYNFEAASAQLMRARVDRLVFTWDNPVARAMLPDQMAAVGGFFFERAGDPVPVVPLIPAVGEDLNLRLRAQARPGTGLIWLYDAKVEGTAARAHPPALGPNWRCQNLGRGRIGVVTCSVDR